MTLEERARTDHLERCVTVGPAPQASYENCPCRGQHVERSRHYQTEAVRFAGFDEEPVFRLVCAACREPWPCAASAAA